VCPPGFQTLGKVSDGRTCYAMGNATSSNIDMCRAADNELTRPAMPTSTLMADALRRLIPTSAAWIGVTTNASGGPWTAYDPSQQNDPYPVANVSELVDMRTISENWLNVVVNEADFIANSSGCLSLGVNGVLDMVYNGSCNNVLAPACEYRGTVRSPMPSLWC
jgi:hypothetical protein